jgi:hypothetical protein
MRRVSLIAVTVSSFVGVLFKVPVCVWGFELEFIWLIHNYFNLFCGDVVVV